AVEIIETDLWQQYNELGGIQDSEVPGGSGSAGRLRRPGRRGEAVTGPGRGRRNSTRRPLPTSAPLPLSRVGFSSGRFGSWRSALVLALVFPLLFLALAFVL